MNASIIVLLLLVSLPTKATDIVVFTDRAHPVHGVPEGGRLVELDIAQRLEAQLDAGLPTDATQAAAIVQDRLVQGSPALQLRLSNAYQDVTDAWRLGIRNLPAVVVDQRYVVYGEADVPRALARIAHYRRAQP